MPNRDPKFWTSNTLRMYVAIAIFAVGATATVLTVYLNREGEQNTSIAVMKKEQSATIKVLEKFDKTLTEQGKLISATSVTVEGIHTEQQAQRRDVNRIESCVDRLENAP